MVKMSAPAPPLMVVVCPGSVALTRNVLPPVPPLIVRAVVSPYS